MFRRQAHTGRIVFFSAQGPLAGRFKVLRCFYPSSQGDPAVVSLSVLENSQDLGRTDRLGRAIQCSRRASDPGLRFALPWAISFCPFGADGSIDPQEFSDHATSN